MIEFGKTLYILIYHQGTQTSVVTKRDLASSYAVMIICAYLSAIRFQSVMTGPNQLELWQRGGLIAFHVQLG